MMYASGSAIVAALFGLTFWLAPIGSLSAQRSLCDPAPAGALVPSRDLYCLSLVASPDFVGVSGRVELGRLPGPFTIAVTADGRIRYAATIRIAGLPEPSSLGRYTTYVAWLATPVMYPVVRLGAVKNGDTKLPEIALDKFVVLVTAERSAMVKEPGGRIVLRGESPSSRLQPPDLMRFAIGAAAVPAGKDSEPMEHMNHEVSMQSAGDSVRWTTVPMPPNLTMLPGEMALRPTVAPYLPRGAGGAAPTEARPYQVVRLADGDTLRLTAGMVTRTLKGHRVTMFGFNGQYPGPLISVPQAATVVVQLENALDQPTSIHWHGVRLDNRFDGVPRFTQEAVPPGGHFTYHVHFPDAGIYWYHPHVREDTQQELGLYGNLFVHSPRRDYFGPANREETLILDDLLVGEDGQLVPFGKDQTTHAFMGRFGSLFLVNGEPDWRMAAKCGEVVRFLFTNVSNTRTLNLSFPGAKMKLVGSDAGNYEHEQWVESVVIAPAERYIVHVRFDKTGDVALVNRVQGLDHLFSKFFYETDTLGVIHVEKVPAKPDLAAAFRQLRTDTAATADIARYRRYFDKPVDHSLLLTIEAHDLPFVSRQLMLLDSAYFVPVEWTGTMPTMNWASSSDEVRWVLRDPDTGKENMDIDWTFHRGDVVKLHLANERRSMHAMQHPIHLHGQRFLVLAVNGVRNDDLVWKDTALIPAGSTVDLLVDLSNPGRWMLHCHIAEHLSAGMMMGFTVN
ncbi:MAG TPA: multicopper oxidase family protein [Gemmatimonadaceae bacterium]|jgi:FtsP/CotA-like multicopper oxidase with cupredoxin domain